MADETSEQLTVNVPWAVQEDLLLDVAAPLLDTSVELGESASWFYLRENQRGNAYLRLVVRTRSPSVLPRLKAHIVEQVGTAARSDEVFRFHDYNYEHSWLGGPGGVDMMHSFWAETTPLALESLRATRGDTTRRLALAFDLLVANGALLAPRLPGRLGEMGFRAGYVSYLATFEGYLLLIRDPESARARYARRFELNRDLLRARTREIIEVMDEPVPDFDRLPNLAARWVRTMNGYLPAIQEGFDEGRLFLYANPRNKELARLAPSPDGLYRRPDVPWLADAPVPPVAGIHRAIADNPYFQGMIREDRRFLASRLAQGYTNWHLYRLGFTLADRYTLFYLVARSFEEEFDLDAVALIRSVKPEPESAR
ncbi:hypothetical protein FHR81_005560 [Actinoalloteichus hoggarensis]|uniref:Thiopeptide-type bacteriocin biosynthesis domain-containing protein n=1 Tax=Actinoalloteichus hoggarensis TaxID=1470176 RepID=A0A221W464_9PSEU|nr:lantibiotic dehydratase C-terminal domain-containing protein [Actinoalloteichus hoggarensis]ASO20672.1 hypothetical protein AHOG_15230 [Actinoalloteichus hoggarensis]MBB5924475.1 hypothetical protein [Actinoalloteichus hoggarensis]